MSRGKFSIPPNSFLQLLDRPGGIPLKRVRFSFSEMNKSQGILPGIRTEESSPAPQTKRKQNAPDKDPSTGTSHNSYHSQNAYFNTQQCTTNHEKIQDFYFSSNRPCFQKNLRLERKEMSQFGIVLS